MTGWKDFGPKEVEEFSEFLEGMILIELERDVIDPKINKRDLIQNNLFGHYLGFGDKF